MSGAKHPQSSADITEEQVRDYLKSHPEFLKDNIEMVASLSAPERDLGNGIIDFQHYMLTNLQKDSKALKSKYDVLIEFCRDNMSVQAQVHQAALKLIRARSLEQLLEVMTIDMVGLFDVDVIRLAMESPLAQDFDAQYNEQDYSGIVAIPPGMTDMALGQKKKALLVPDCAKARPVGFDEIFADCTGLIQSCALLRLDLEKIQKDVILAFGVRHKNRFHSGQGIELLNFLAQIVAYRLDGYLHELL